MRSYLVFSFYFLKDEIVAYSVGILISSLLLLESTYLFLQS